MEILGERGDHFCWCWECRVIQFVDITVGIIDKCNTKEMETYGLVGTFEDGAMGFGLVAVD